MAEMTEDVRFERGSGNVFLDIGLPDAEELHGKSRMVVTINRSIELRGLDRKEAAKLLGTTQKNIALLAKYALDEFSIEQLMHFANALEYEVVIELRPRAHAEGVTRTMHGQAA